MVVVALLSVYLVESVDVVSVYLVVNCMYLYVLATRILATLVVAKSKKCYSEPF